MRHITADIARKNSRKHLNNVKRFFMKRLKEISQQGNSSATFNPKDYQECLDELLAWLKSLGFVCSQENDDCVRVAW